MTLDNDERHVATLRDVAAEARVSISTASRALTGSRPVSPDLSQRVSEAAERLNYRANVGARSLRLSRTLTIGVLFERMDGPVYLDILSGLTAAADAIGYSVIVANADGDIEHSRRYVQRLYERRVDALMLSGLRASLRPDLEPFVRAGVPTLGLFGREREVRDIPVAITPQVAPLTEGMRRLRALGHQRVLYLENIGSLSNRWRYVESAAREAGLEPVRCPVVFNLSPTELHEALATILEAESTATAIFAHSRHVAGLNRAMRERGESIPRDRSVATFTDSRYTVGLMDPPLSSINVDTVEFGRRALAIVESWMNGKAPENITLLDLAEWHETGSVGVAPPR
ncbi:MAG: LacI family DNA-binding transcriptional regulator [Chloroflexi bacterium]|nr:LacI family DNA-binding transcriptional regulator [Chloroflexota bacterium]MDA1146124.1 LacI family DNA-binding transcriptional regulator [Chloroflexota bacterium]